MLIAKLGSCEPMLVRKWKNACTPPHQEWWPMIATSAPIAPISTTRKNTLRYSERQNQVRRRATTSSSLVA